MLFANAIFNISTTFMQLTIMMEFYGYSHKRHRKQMENTWSLNFFRSLVQMIPIAMPVDQASPIPPEAAQVGLTWTPRNVFVCPLTPYKCIHYIDCRDRPFFRTWCITTRLSSIHSHRYHIAGSLVLKLLAFFSHYGEFGLATPMCLKLE